MKFKIIITLLACLILSASLIAQKRAFTIEDLYKVKSVGTPVLSNDGCKVVFTVSESDMKKGESNTDIYLMNVDGSELVQLTNNESADFNPMWLNNDKGIYFISYRSGASQIYYLPIDGGESKQITNFELGISFPQISSDGKLLAFTTKVFPEYGLDIEKNKKTKKSMNNGPIQAHIADSLFVRHWTEYNDGLYSHIIIYDFETEEYKDITPGFYHSPAFSAGGSGEFTFSPDSKEIVFTSKRVKNPASSTNIDIWTVNIASGETNNLTKENLAADTDPKYSPDGKYIAFKRQSIPAYESDLITLAIYNVQTRETKIISSKFDNWVDEYEWSHNSEAVYFTAPSRGYHPLYKINIDNNEIIELTPKKTVFGFTVSASEDFAIIRDTKVEKPLELKLVDLVNESEKYITSFNKEILDEVDFRSAEQVWVDGADGKKVHLFIVKPHGFDPDKKYPLVINVHGGPQYQWMDAFRGDWQVYPGSGYVVAFPNPHGSTGYGQDYTAAISGDWDGKVYDDVMAVTDYLSKLSYVDENRMGAMGWSYGGYFMNLLQAKSKKFKCLASMMGIYDLETFYRETEELWFPKWDLKGDPTNSKLYFQDSPSSYSENFSTPTLIITGEKDYRISYTQSIQYFTVLQRMKIDSRLIIFKNDGHWPSHLKSMPLYYNSHLEWFNKYLGGKVAPYSSKKMIRNLIFE
ncbi:MAG: S9 family peptidase [Melioribacteraceae bacterium]|nr:S9 family peptidase [Melioribacteraceae bacterium]